MSWIQNIANTISALWTGNYCQSRIDKAKMVVVENEPPQTTPPVNENKVPSKNNQSSISQKVFAPELMDVDSKKKRTDWKFFSNPTEMDKLELCKRILQDNFPTHVGDGAKNTFNIRLSKCFEEKIIGKEKKIGTDLKLKFQNLNDDESKNLIASVLNGLQCINDEQLKQRIEIILENLDNKEAFNYYMDLFPKTSSNSRESSPGMDSRRESSPGILPRGQYSPAGSMTPPSATSKGIAVFLRSPSSISTDSEIR